jgi:hypothetical protein
LNFRTVISFGPTNIEYLITRYNKLLEFPNRSAVKMSHLAGLAFGYAFLIRFVFIGVVFYISSYIIDKYKLPKEENYLSVYALFMAALGAGMNASNVPSVAKAK